MGQTLPDRSPWLWAAGLVFPAASALCLHADAVVVPIVVLATLVTGIALWFAGPTLTCAFLSVFVAPFLTWRDLTAVPIALVLLLPVLLVRGRATGDTFPFKKQAFLLLAGFALGHALSIVASGSLSTSALWWDSQFILMSVMCVVTFCLLRSETLTPHRFAVLVALGGLPFLVMILLRYAQQGILGGLLTGRLGTPVQISANLVATALDPLVPFSVFLFAHERRRAAKMFYLALAFAYTVAILLTYSRGSMFGLAALALFLVVRYRSRGTVLFLSVASTVFILYFGAQYLLRFQARDQANMLSNLGRVLLYSTAVDMLKSGHYLVGIGMNQFSQLKYAYGFPRWFDPVARMSSHNMYLEMWVSWGLAGIVGWVWLLLSNTAALFMGAFDKRDMHVRLAVAFSILSFALHGFVDCVLASNYAMFFVFSIMGCGAYLLGRTAAPRQAEHHS